MKFLLITESLGYNFEPQLIKELKKLDVNTEIIDLSKIKTFIPKKYDLIYARLMPYENCGLISYYLSKTLEIKSNKFVDSPENILNYQNKLLCYELLKDKIPIVKTELLLPNSKIGKKFEKTKIVKPLFGRAGYCVEKISKNSPKLLTLYLKKKSISYLTYPYIVQDYIDFEKLVRVIILNKKPVFALSTDKKNWKCSIYKKAYQYSLDNKLKNYSKIAAEEMNLNIGAFDFFFKDGEYIFNEFNYCCDLPEINKMVGFNFHKKVSKFFLNLVKK